jgi:hypothetical protein
VDKRWEVETKIGEGTFSEIYGVRDIKGEVAERCALKIDKEEIKSSKLNWESTILLSLQEEGDIVPRHHQFGEVDKKKVGAPPSIVAAPLVIYIYSFLLWSY